MTTIHTLHSRAAEPRPLPFTTLTSVEFRKMTDTRSGRWLIATIITLVTGILVWKVSHPSIEPAFDNYAGAAATFIAFLAPLIGLLAVTSEWTQRTALTTFTLVPRRAPVVAAKYLASIGLTLGLLAVSVGLAAGLTMLGGAIHGDASFAGLTTELRSYAIVVVLQVTMAMAIALLAGQTPLAITAFLIAPTVWGALSSQVLKGASPWFDVFSAYDRLASTQPLEHFAQTVSAVMLWVVLPSALGLARSLRREVK
jgi:hypothetical protein